MRNAGQAGGRDYLPPAWHFVCLTLTKISVFCILYLKEFIVRHTQKVGNTMMKYALRNLTVLCAAGLLCGALVSCGDAPTDSSSAVSIGATSLASSSINTATSTTTSARLNSVRLLSDGSPEKQFRKMRLNLLGESRTLQYSKTTYLKKDPTLVYTSDGAVCFVNSTTGKIFAINCGTGQQSYGEVDEHYIRSFVQDALNRMGLSYHENNITVKAQGARADHLGEYADVTAENAQNGHVYAMVRNTLSGWRICRLEFSENCPLSVPDWI